MQDAFREVLRDIVYRHWKLAVGYRRSLMVCALPHGGNVPDDLLSMILEADELVEYLESDPMFSPNRNLPIRACTLRVCE